MKKNIAIYDLHDPQQYEDEREYWRSKTPAQRLQALEQLRAQWHHFNSDKDGSNQRFQRVLRFIEPE